MLMFEDENIRKSIKMLILGAVLVLLTLFPEIILTYLEVDTSSLWINPGFLLPVALFGIPGIALFLGGCVYLAKFFIELK